MNSKNGRKGIYSGLTFGMKIQVRQIGDLDSFLLCSVFSRSMHCTFFSFGALEVQVFLDIQGGFKFQCTVGKWHLARQREHLNRPLKYTFDSIFCAPAKNSSVTRKEVWWLGLVRHGLLNSPRTPTYPNWLRYWVLSWCTEIIHRIMMNIVCVYSKGRFKYFDVSNAISHWCVEMRITLYIPFIIIS